MSRQYSNREHSVRHSSAEMGDRLPDFPATQVILGDAPGTMQHIPVELLLQGPDKTLPWLQGNNLFVFQGEQGDQLDLSSLLPEGSKPGEWQKAEGSLTLSGVTYALYQHDRYEAEFLIQMGMITNFS